MRVLLVLLLSGCASGLHTYPEGIPVTVGKEPQKGYIIYNPIFIPKRP